MNIQRFLAATSREAMSKARAAFGDSAVILSSRATTGGFEVVATSEENLGSLPVGGAAASLGASAPRAAADRLAADTPRGDEPARRPTLAERTNSVERDTETMAMSTLSFQDYVRERMLKRRKEALEAKAAGERPGNLSSRAAVSALGAAALEEAFGPRRATAPVPSAPAPRPALATPVAPAPIVTREQSDWVASLSVPPHMPALGTPAPAANISGELSALRDMIEDRFNMLAWLGTSRTNPLQSNLMLKLIRAGYSPTLVRSVLERLPAEGGPAEAVRWVMDVLARNLKTPEPQNDICEEGGVVSLIGATGVGKTTTAAKLAAQCVKTHGANSVGLITLDTYRVAGYEQLRSYGRMMGVVAHLAHDRAALKDLLNLLSGKRLVVIDTAGLGQKDPRIQEMLEVLAMPGVKKMLVLNASNHGDTMDDVLSSFQAKALHGVVLSKVDEAVKLGPAVDALIRHQVVLRGVANGQRVPEDWQAPDAAALVRASMGTEGKSAFDPAPSELGFFFAQPAQKQMNLGALRV